MATKAVSEKLEQRRREIQRAPITEFSDFANAVADIAAATRSEIWPDLRWKDDPVGFATTILGVELWSRQIEILESICNHRHTAVIGGRKIGKDFVVGVAVLWWFATFPDARGILLAVTGDQIEDVLWREIKKLHHNSGRCLACKKADPRDRRTCAHSIPLDGVLNDRAETGLRSDKPGDLREIVGMTAKQAESAAGLSGTRVLFVQDEASGQNDDINNAILGNMASDQCRRVIISNGTRNEGFFWQAFHEPSDAKVHNTFQVSSLESPNIVHGREIFPGLAGTVWIAEMKRIWGEDSAEYAIHVLGKFAENETLRVISYHDIQLSKARWKTTATPAGERLYIGLDVAGEGEDGDETVYVLRRGLKMLAMFTFRGLSVEDHLAHAIGFAKANRLPREDVPIITVDREGPIGYRVWIALDAYADAHPKEFIVAGVRASSEAIEKINYWKRRDELWASCREWIRRGGAILTEPKLEAELHKPQWIQDPSNGRKKITEKKLLRKVLKRSPDRADALCLAVWEPQDFELGGTDSKAGHDRKQSGQLAEGQGMDPYSVESAHDEHTQRDPIYGG